MTTSVINCGLWSIRDHNPQMIKLIRAG